MSISKTSTIPDARLPISEVAAATGLSAHTLRYYERADLMLAPIDRAGSTHRRYAEADVNWVIFLTRLRSTGMPIRTIGDYTRLVREGDATVTERLALLVRHREAVLAQLAEVESSLAAIDYKIALYEEMAPGQTTGRQNDEQQKAALS